MRHALQWQEAQLRFNRSGARALTAVILTATGLLAGCVSVKSFVDPNGDSAKYEELVKPSEPLKLKVSVEFQRNGEHIEKVDSSLQD